ncbi:MAG: sulfatase-like hydrolase/transferase, partial [Verrucomicrobiota bacterium]
RTSNVPFIWAGPGIARGKAVDATVSLIDTYPTLVDLCGLPAPDQKLEGVSLGPVLANPESAVDRNVFLPHMNPGEYAIINRDWRYIRYGEDGEELYRLREDPHEWNNLASDPAYEETMARLRKAAPTSFAPPAKKLNVRKDLVLEGESFRWSEGEGNGGAASSGRKWKPTTGVAGNRLGERPRNVLLFVCDDLNTHVSPTGYGPILTPNLAGFAESAVTFNRAFCQYPVCGPSRASFLTGLYPQSTGVLDNKADIRTRRPETVSMPQFFQDHGYWTGAVGKVFHSPHHEPGEVAWSEAHRFENDELPIVAEARKAFEAEHGPVGDRKNRRAWKMASRNASASLTAQTPPGYGRSGLTDEQHKDGKNARQVAKWLTENAEGDKRFFIACGLQKPHVPFLAPSRYFDLYPKDQIVYQPDPPDLWAALPGKAVSRRFEAFGFKLGEENDARRRKYMQAYHACVSFIDAQVGLVLKALEDAGHGDDTIVLFTSDHGYHLGDHFLWGKVTLFDIGARVPFLVRVPGLTKGGTSSEAMVELIDIFPTLADLTGLQAPAHLQGGSLRPLLAHPERRGKKKMAYSVVARGKSLGFALRNQRWRYGKWPDGEELYNLTEDPTEKRNLAGDPKYAERLKTFRQALAEKQIEASARRSNSL